MKIVARNFEFFSKNYYIIKYKKHVEQFKAFLL